MYGSGKVIVAKTSKKKAEQFCLGLLQQGLTVIISPDESSSEDRKRKQELWQVILPEGEVQTSFNYVVQSLTKVITTLSHRAACEICIQMHGNGMAIVTKTSKEQAEQFCLGLQQQGFMACIAPDESSSEEGKRKQELWQVILQKGTGQTSYNYVLQSLTKVIDTLNCRTAFEICVQMHGTGKAIVTKTSKEQAEQFCLGLQQQGLIACIVPDKSSSEEGKRKQELWQVILQKSEVLISFNYLVGALTKVIDTLDCREAFELHVQNHGNGKLIVIKTTKEQAEKFCLGLQQQGLTVIISPDEEDFDG
jgi:ATP-dependent Clp protease adapter protein ClpS